ncbi:MAG: hypothetical protein NTV86_23445 [Planctomycetota bacterium]|nr:hypothetical protein [Planctomycetota bacterium]
MKRRNAMIAGMFLAACLALAGVGVVSSGQPAGETPAPATQTATQPAPATPQAQDYQPAPMPPAPEPLVTKFYYIEDLSRPGTNYVYWDFPTKPALDRPDSTGMFGSPQARQGQGEEEINPSDQRGQIRSLVDLIRETALPQDNWDAPPTGSIRVFQGTLIVRHTEKAHAAVAALLAQLRTTRQRGLVLDAAWVRGDQAQFDALLKKPADKADPRLVDPAALAKANIPYRARIACRNGQRTYVTAGRGYTIVNAWSMPTDGAGLVPEVSYARGGVLLDATSVLDAASKQANVTLSGTIVWPRSDKAPDMPARPGQISAQDFDMHDFMSTVSVPVGQWVMTSGVTLPAKDKDNQKDDQMILVIRVLAVGE